ncbi:GapR family DNA-binding domain-containing protein [Rhizobium sp. ZK1]|uniref:GapR family DNA-binding domain-containing protein n=1 Tax=Rhizobium sp. ZK1 TaxID=3389872 RepID=UPI0039F6F962
MSADTQIKSYFQRWKRLEGEKKAISDDLKELFSEAKHAGYDSKALRAAFNRKLKQDAGPTADQQFDMVVDTYLDAIKGVARDARMRARENIEEFDPETGEAFEPNLADGSDQSVWGPMWDAGDVDLFIGYASCEDRHCKQPADADQLRQRLAHWAGHGTGVVLQVDPERHR